MQTLANIAITTETPPADAPGLIVRPIGGTGGGDVTIIDPIGQKPMADSVAVVIASDQTPIPVTGSFSPSGTQDVNLIEVGGAAVTLGQKLSAASIPVVLASDETVPVTGNNFDIRDLAFATDKVDVSGSTGVGVTGPLTDVQLRAVPVPVSGTVSTGGLTDTQLRATPVPVSGPLTDTQLRATPVPVSGTVTASGPLTDAQLRATAVPVSGSVAHDSPVSATIPENVSAVAQDMDDTAPPNRVSAENDVTRLASDRDGGLFVHPHGPQLWSYHEDSSSALTDAVVHASPGTGLSLYVTDIVVSTGAATAFNVFFEEGSTKVLGPYYLEAINGRGIAIHFQTPKKITAATALTITTSAAIAHSVDITGFVAAG